MLTQYAFEIVNSTKRGHAPGAKESIVEQAVRVAANVKARQTKVQDSSLDFLENKIKTDNLLDHKVILFLLEPGQIDRNVAGLICNKLAPKYQRPCCILTKVTENIAPPWEDPEYQISYQGSARGCDSVGITEFKSICEASGCIMYATGHQGAFGLGILEENIQKFLTQTDEILKDMPDEPVYHVDFIWNENEIQPQAVLDIADLDELWGKDFPEAFIAIQNLRITPEMVTIYEKKGYTIKIELHNGINLMLFRASELDCNKLQTNNTGYVDINVIAKCNRNEWMGNVIPQLFVENYEIIDSKKYFF